MILSIEEAREALRVDDEENDSIVNGLLASIDAYIKGATGLAYADPATAHPVAKQAARLLLVQWFDHPDSYVGSRMTGLEYGVNALLTQLQYLPEDANGKPCRSEAPPNNTTEKKRRKRR